jgi:hypothetical protein
MSNVPGERTTPPATPKPASPERPATIPEPLEKKQEELRPAETPLSPADKLAFLRDYLVRTRFDIMQDKETLTRLFYAKIALFGALSLILVSHIGNLCRSVFSDRLVLDRLLPQEALPRNFRPVGYAGGACRAPTKEVARFLG